MKPFPGTVRRQGQGGKYVLNEEQEAWLRRWFPVTENKRLSKASGIKLATIHRLARDLGLTKSEEGLKAIKKRQAAHIKRVCEKSGYYASKRGKPLSPQCHEGARRMWQEIHEGKREKPILIMKREHPRRYKKMLQRRSEVRREAMAMEKKRMRWGLPRKTNLANVVMQPYRLSQTNRRYGALKRGYILADTCAEGSGHRFVIYYDDNTKRAPIFERNCIKDGFRFERWEED